MNRRAFTLIELLVVIAIIAILAAILFPVFAQAKASAKATASLSSVKQIMTSIVMYNSDNDDMQVPGLWYDRGDGYWNSWMEMVYPYIKNKDIFINPSCPKSYSSYGVTGVPTTSVVVSHYIWAGWVPYNYWDWWGTVMFAGFPIPNNPANAGTCGSLPWWATCTDFSNVADPANSAFIVPGYYVASPVQGMAFGDAWTTGLSPDHGLPNPVDEKFHPFRQGANYGMVDSHAKWYSSKNMNGNASRPHMAGSSGPYPSSPFMVVME